MKAKSFKEFYDEFFEAMERVAVADIESDAPGNLRNKLHSAAIVFINERDIHGLRAACIHEAQIFHDEFLKQIRESIARF